MTASHWPWSSQRKVRSRLSASNPESRVRTETRKLISACVGGGGVLGPYE
ncbi:hypothetical protein ACFRQM_20325 [Streptomyces sp. NPDC056831]